MKRGYRWEDTHRTARIARASLVAMTLAFSVAGRADEPAATGADTEAGAVVPAPDAAVPVPRRHGPPRHLTAAQSIDEGVRRLTRALELDPAQQERARNILVDQQRQIMKLRASGSAVAGDATGRTLAVYDQTKARIRAMLNDEQKKKYIADVPRDGLAPGQADLKHWMDIQEAKRRQGLGEDESK
jgi:hypothetical protein